jgi:hypothetical protein
MNFELTLRSFLRGRDWIAPSEPGIAFARGRLGTRREAIVNRSSEGHIARPCCGIVSQELSFCRFDNEAKRFLFESPAEVQYATV